MSLHPVMKRRTDRAARILKSYGEEVNGKEQNKYEPIPQTMGDLVSDILHFCDLHRIDFDLVLENARGNHEAERGDGDDIEQDFRRLEG